MVLPPKADFFLSKYTLVRIPANSNTIQYQLCSFGVLRDAITGHSLVPHIR